MRDGGKGGEEPPVNVFSGRWREEGELFNATVIGLARPPTVSTVDSDGGIGGVTLGVYASLAVKFRLVSNEIVEG